MSGAREYCTFRVGTLKLGLGVEYVQEVMRLRQMTPVPLSAPFVCGLINLRGRIITVIDLHHRLALPAPQATPASMLVVCHAAGGSVSFLVDSICDVTRAPDQDVLPVPPTLSPEIGAMVRGVLELEDELLLLLDAERAAEIKFNFAEGDRVDDPLAVER